MSITHTFVSGISDGSDATLVRPSNWNAAHSGSPLTWTEITGTTQAMTTNNGYIANNASLVTLTLPSTFAIGDVIEILGKGAGLWSIAQNASQTIHFGTSTSTAGTGGAVTATNQYDCLSLRCITANTDLEVLGSQGTFIVV